MKYPPAIHFLMPPVYYALVVVMLITSVPTFSLCARPPESTKTHFLYEMTSRIELNNGK